MKHLVAKNTAKQTPMADGLDKAPALLAETLALVFAAGFD
jgi:hypothetical protein